MIGTPMSLQSLAAMANVLSRSHDVREVLETAAEDARAAMDAATVSIGQVDIGADVVRTIVNVGDLAPDEERWPENEVYPIAGDDRLMAAIHELTSWTDDITDPDCAPRERAMLEQLGKGSSLVTPIVVDGHPWGEFYATRHIGAEPFDSEAIAFAEVVAAILAAAVSRTLREAELQSLAFHDALTGVFNRRGLDERVDTLFDLGEEPEREVAVVAVDINGLKRINDTEGHLSGDQQIRNVAAALMEGFTPMATSVVARVGGDEFTVMVADVEVAVVEDAINEVCQRVYGHDSAIGVSAGIASAVITPTSTVTPAALLAAADEALYVAKRSESLVAVRADDVVITVASA
ncbi:MAG: sensor domain-containing diguanylate cyclase [Aeromicrobium sp.]